ncbi:MAG: family 1 glycosylhydrolase [Acidimicrobiales bacterium]
MPTSTPPLPEDFLFGVATAGFQIEGGFNGPGQPANNWLTWEQLGRVEPSGVAADFWAHPEEALDRAAGLGCNSFRLGLEWARVEPREGEIDDAALAGYASILDGCTERGMAPLVTLLHFTHPAWLGEEFWLRADSSERYRAWVEVALGALAGKCRHWVTLNEVNAVGLGSWILGIFPPGRRMAFGDAAVAMDNQLAGHVLGYEAVHRARPDAVVTTNAASVSLYEFDALLTDILMARSMGIDRADLDRWLDDRRVRHYAAHPTANWGEQVLRRLSAATSPYGVRSPRAPGARRTGGGALVGPCGSPIRPRSPGRAVDAVYASVHERTLDVVGFDYYDPLAARHLRLPGHVTAGGRAWAPARELWDDVPNPDGLRAWLEAQHAMTPDVPLWVVENGLCNRVHNARSYPRLDGWDRSRYLRENIAAVVSAADAGLPVGGYWHWSLVDNYEWGSYQPRFGLFGLDRHHGPSGAKWLDTDSLGGDAAGTYRRIIAGLRNGDRSVLTEPA